MRHRFHALCPYFAMFPEDFPLTWIERLTEPGEAVLDPFCGRGTTPFAALLAGRRAIGTDVNDVAHCVTRAKCLAPSLRTVLTRLNMLEREYDPDQWEEQCGALPEFFELAFARRTLAQVVYLRHALNWRSRRSDSMIAALVIGSLHGESARSDRYLSNQMPRTISTKPRYSLKFWRERNLYPPERDAFDLARRMARYRYESLPPHGDVCILGEDMRVLPGRTDRFPGSPRLVVTSPPYLDVTNFEEDQWLRLWFLGGPPIPTKGRLSNDDRHTTPGSYWRFIADMWRCLGEVVAPGGHVVIRLAARREEPQILVDLLHATGRFSNRELLLEEYEVSAIRRRQTPSFRPGSNGCLAEVDVHFKFQDGQRRN